MPLLRSFLLSILLAGALARPASLAAQPDVQMCTEQPVPPGYVVVGTASRGDCRSTFGATYNSVTIRLPGDTVTVCSLLTRLTEGYVVTRRGNHGACPSTFGEPYNTTTYQRVGPVAGGAGREVVAFEPMNPYDRTVFRRMGERARQLRLASPTHHPWLARTADGTAVSTRLDLDGGSRYTLLAVCDEDCGDVDLRVTDNGYLLGEDTNDEDYAAVELSPARNVRVTVEVEMGECRSSPCHFLVGVYETPRAGAVPPRRPPTGDVRITPRPRP
jgi:hypothetical protein